MSKPGAASPHEFYYYGGRGHQTGPNLRTVRDRRWKLHLARDGYPSTLYDLGEDPGEQFDRLELFPEIAAKPQARAESFNAELTAKVRPPGGAE